MLMALERAILFQPLRLPYDKTLIYLKGEIKGSAAALMKRLPLHSATHFLHTPKRYGDFTLNCYVEIKLIALKAWEKVTFPLQFQSLQTKFFVPPSTHVSQTILF